MSVVWSMGNTFLGSLKAKIISRLHWSIENFSLVGMRSRAARDHVRPTKKR